MPMRSVLAAALMLAATPALAFECPSLMADVDAALASASLSAAEQLRAEGEALHDTGDHAASVERLNAAKAILGL